MRFSRVLAAAAIAVTTTIVFASSAHAALLPCDGDHDIEINVTTTMCVQADYPRI